MILFYIYYILCLGIMLTLSIKQLKQSIKDKSVKEFKDDIGWVIFSITPFSMFFIPLSAVAFIIGIIILKTDNWIKYILNK